MPSTVVASGRDGPVVKRQKLNGVDAPRSTVRESRIFTPFRVRLAEFVFLHKPLIVLTLYRPLAWSLRLLCLSH